VPQGDVVHRQDRRPANRVGRRGLFEEAAIEEDPGFHQRVKTTTPTRLRPVSSSQNSANYFLSRLSQKARFLSRRNKPLVETELTIVA
jgi:hypothetical protein